MKKLFPLLVLLCIPLSIFANGAPAYAKSSLWSVGNPTFRSISSIHILSERLNIKLNKDYSDVSVTYVLWNDSDTDFNNIEYGFPIDYVKAREPDSSFDWKDSYIRSIEFRENEKILPHTKSSDIPLKEPSNNQKDKLYEWNFWLSPESRDTYRKWFYTSLNIAKRSSIVLQVNYSIENRSGDNEPAAPWDLNGNQWYQLAYDFSPAHYWGDGIIRDFYIQIETTDLDVVGNFSKQKPIQYFYQEEEYDDPKDFPITIKGLNFKKNGNFYTYRTKNFKLKESDPLVITYYMPLPLESYIHKLINSNEYSFRVSTEQSNYPKLNLIDLDLSTAWVSTNQAETNHWVEFEFNKPKAIQGFLIVNGYHKSKKTYEENNRVKKLKVTLTYPSDNATENLEESIIVDIPDNEFQEIYLSELLNKSYFYDFAYDAEIPIKKIRLTILEVYEGTKYNDTCISEVLLFRYD